MQWGRARKEQPSIGFANHIYKLCLEMTFHAHQPKLLRTRLRSCVANMNHKKDLNTPSKFWEIFPFLAICSKSKQYVLSTQHGHWRLFHIKETRVRTHLDAHLCFHTDQKLHVLMPCLACLVWIHDRHVSVFRTVHPKFLPEMIPCRPQNSQKFSWSSVSFQKMAFS